MGLFKRECDHYFQIVPEGPRSTVSGQSCTVTVSTAPQVECLKCGKMYWLRKQPAEGHGKE